MTTPTKPSDAAMKAAKKIRERNGVSYYLGDCDNLPDTDAYEVVAAIIDAELKPQREAMEWWLNMGYNPRYRIHEEMRTEMFWLCYEDERGILHKDFAPMTSKLALVELAYQHHQSNPTTPHDK